MPLEDQILEALLPSYLSSTDKDRLKTGLKQFSQYGDFTQTYDNFYSLRDLDHLAQGDILHSQKTVDWNSENSEYENITSSVIVISNSCDINSENKRVLNSKEILFAPVLPLSEVLADFEVNGFNETEIKSFLTTLKSQLFSNLFYLPKSYKKEEEFIVYFDRTHWHPNEEINKVNLENDRFISLSSIGFYVFILKLSYHFCRLPEERERD